MTYGQDSACVSEKVLHFLYKEKYIDIIISVSSFFFFWEVDTNMALKSPQGEENKRDEKFSHPKEAGSRRAEHPNASRGSSLIHWNKSATMSLLSEKNTSIFKQLSHVFIIRLDGHFQLMEYILRSSSCQYSYHRGALQAIVHGVTRVGHDWLSLRFSSYIKWEYMTENIFQDLLFEFNRIHTISKFTLMNLYILIKEIYHVLWSDCSLCDTNFLLIKTFL